MEEYPHRWTALLLILLSLTVAPYFMRLGASSLWDSNEAFYAETPREMLESGDYLNPHFNYQPRFNKPPLCYWVVAGFYKVFGVSEAVERLAIALGAAVLIATACALARLAYSTPAGLLAAAGIAASPRFLMFSRRIMIDIYIAMFMSLALLFFALAMSRPGRRKKWLTLMYVSVGLGIMTKGPVAALLPAIAFAVFLLVTRQLAFLRRMMLPIGILIVAAIVLPWYAAVYSTHGWGYIQSFLVGDNISRYAGQPWGPSRGIFFYLPVLLGDLFPWSLLLAPAVWLAVKTRPGKSEALASSAPSGARESLPLLFTIWIGVIVLFFSFSRSKEDLYILPAYAAGAALTGGLLDNFKGLRLPRLFHFVTASSLAVISMVLVVAGSAVILMFARVESPYLLHGAVLIGCAGITGGLATGASLALRKRGVALAVSLASLALANWAFALRTLPDFERYKPVVSLCDRIQRMGKQDALVGYYRYASPSMTFYLRRQIFELYRPEDLSRLLSGEKTVLCVISETEYLAVRDALPVQTYVLASHPVFQVKLRGILDRVLPPQVLLISNRVEQSVPQ
jgi:4-amino-4-deoxy-L-arabinose transferase-like glycosyltransferase